MLKFQQAFHWSKSLTRNSSPFVTTIWVNSLRSNTARAREGLSSRRVPVSLCQVVSSSLVRTSNPLNIRLPGRAFEIKTVTGSAGR